MRPRNLEEYIGQDHIIGPGRLLRRAIQADQLTSVIFYGPPGTGKTTLARVIANHTKSNFVTLNAVLAGVQQIRDSIAAAEDQKRLYGRRTILFVDEVHRWNRAQQDALLPWVENGTIILIGATTENPFFEVNKALVSRSRVFQLKALQREDLMKAALACLSDAERGYGRWKVSFEDGALEHLVDTASGDARSLLNALELAVETSVPSWPPADGAVILIDKQCAEESIQKKVVLYDRDGDYHYDVISAFIKSLRGRDPDAALYWLARMIAAGEDPAFIFRRMIISACEDTGLADPHAITVVESCAAAFDRIGLPEGRFHLTHAALYLATASKSNSAMAFFDALAAVEQEDTEVPNHLKDGNRDAEGFGHGQGYQYPHAWKDHWVAQQYLPDALAGRVFYSPSTQGHEGRIREEVLTRRELQIASIIEENPPEGPAEPGRYDRFHFGSQEVASLRPAGKGEILTFSPGGSRRDEWQKRTESNRSEALLQLRTAITGNAEILRHHRILVDGADDGLLIWEAGRLAPEGYACGLCRTTEGKALLEQYAKSLEELDRPELIAQSPGEENPFAAPFDRILARDPALTAEGVLAWIQARLPWCAPGALIVCSLAVPSRGMRLSSLIPADSEGLEEIRAAENDLYENPADPIFSWNAASLAAMLKDAELRGKLIPHVRKENRYVSEKDLRKWLSSESAYGNALGRRLTHSRIDDYAKKLEAAIRNGPVAWERFELICVIPASGEGARIPAD